MEKEYFREDTAKGLFTLTITRDSAADLDSLIGSAFAGAAVSRSALLVLIGEGCDFGAVARLLQPAMVRPAPFRPAAVSVVVPQACKHLASELSFTLARDGGVILGDFTNAARATAHALSWRSAVIEDAYASSSSKVRRVWSIRATARARRGSLSSSNRRASSIALSLSGFRR